MRAEIVLLGKRVDMARQTRRRALVAVSYTHLLRIYTESCSKESVEKLLESARKFALGG